MLLISFTFIGSWKAWGVLSGRLTQYTVEHSPSALRLVGWLKNGCLSGAISRETGTVIVIDIFSGGREGEGSGGRAVKLRTKQYDWGEGRKGLCCNLGKKKKKKKKKKENDFNYTLIYCVAEAVLYRTVLTLSSTYYTVKT